MGYSLINRGEFPDDESDSVQSHYEAWGNSISNFEDLYNSNPLNLRSYGALGDGVNDNTAIQEMLADSSEGDVIYIPRGVYVATESINAKEGQKWIFENNAWLKLDDQGVNDIYGFFSIAPGNITLVNPHLDRDRDNNVAEAGVQGRYTCLSLFDKNAGGCRVYGGKIRNSPNTLVHGGANNFIMRDTILKNCGEHAMYLSGGEEVGYNDMTIQGVKIRNSCDTADTGIPDAHYFQIKHVDNVTLRDIEAFGANSRSGLNTHALNVTDSNNLLVDGCKFDSINANGLSVKDSNIVKVINSSFDKRNANSSESSAFVNNQSGTNVRFKNCDLYGGNMAGDGPDKGFIDCDFYEITSHFEPTNNIKYVNCNFSLIDNYTDSFGFFTVSDPICTQQDFIDCKLIGDAPEGFRLDGNCPDDFTLNINGFEFDGYTGNYGFRIFGGSGKNHEIKRVKCMSSTDPDFLQIGPNSSSITVAEFAIAGDLNIVDPTNFIEFANRTNLT